MWQACLPEFIRTAIQRRSTVFVVFNSRWKIWKTLSTHMKTKSSFLSFMVRKREQANSQLLPVESQCCMVRLQQPQSIKDYLSLLSETLPNSAEKNIGNAWGPQSKFSVILPDRDESVNMRQKSALALTRLIENGIGYFAQLNRGWLHGVYKL